MKSVNIAELKNRLSHYLQEVRAGEEILVRDRQQPIARIVPFPQPGDTDAEMLRLAAEGKVRLGEVEGEEPVVLAEGQLQSDLLPAS